MWGLGSLSELDADLSLSDAMSKVAPYDLPLVGYGGELKNFVQEIYARGYTASDQSAGSLSDAEVASLVRDSSAISAGNKKSLINSVSTLRENGFFVQTPKGAAPAVTAETLVAKVSDPAVGKPVTKKLTLMSALQLVAAAAGGARASLADQQKAAQKIMEKQARGGTVYEPSKISLSTVVLIIGGVAVLGLAGYVFLIARPGRK